MCHRSILYLSMIFAISLADSAFHCIHSVRLSSGLSTPFVCFVNLRHHLVYPLSAAVMLANRSGVPYSMHGCTNDCWSLILEACEVEVLRRSTELA